MITKKVLNHIITRDVKNLQYLVEKDVFFGHFQLNIWGVGLMAWLSLPTVHYDCSPQDQKQCDIMQAKDSYSD